MRKVGLLKTLMGALFACCLATAVLPASVHAQAPGRRRSGDPTGAATGTAKDVTVKDPAAPTLTEVMDTVGHNKVAINIVWTLLAGFLVMFMQAGFALVETGFCRAKNAAHTMSMNFMVYPLGMFGFWVCGFALQMGGVGAVARARRQHRGAEHEFTIKSVRHSMGLFGLKGFFLSGDAYDVGVFTLFLFQMVFMDTTATIPTGAMAERWKFAFFIFALLHGAFIYPVFGNWVWGGGWLAPLGSNFGLGHGHVDFAGSSVVHMDGGVAALAGAIVLGPRIGKYTKTASRSRFPGTTSRWPSSARSSWRSAGSASTRLHAGGHRPAHRRRRGQHDAGRHGGALAAMCYMWSSSASPTRA